MWFPFRAEYVLWSARAGYGNEVLLDHGSRTHYSFDDADS